MKTLINHTAAALGMAALVATAAVSSAAPDEAALLAKEKAAWQAFKDGKADDFKKLVAPNMMAVYPEGISTLEQEIARMPKVKMKSFVLSDYKVVSTDDDTAIATYTAKVEGSAEGTDMSGTYNCASIWQMKDGEWRAIFHTDMKAAEPETAQKKE